MSAIPDPRRGSSTDRELTAGLLCDRAVTGLGEGEASQLRLLLRQDRGLADDSFELCAAALDLGLFPAREPMPAAVRERCRLRLDAVIAASGRQGSTRTEPVGGVGPRTAGRGGGWGSIGWLAAAGVALAWGYSALGPSLGRGSGDPRDRLVAGGAQRWSLSPAKDPLCGSNCGGEIVWGCDGGAIEVHGLAANDPAQHQYQLWIFDGSRDDRYPIDGGVFDVGPSGQAVIPIRPPLKVRDPVLFAVTVEPPGGSVVSERRIVLTAKP
jgi:hypothetical protein